MRPVKTIDLNKVLAAANPLVAAALLIAFPQAQDNPYVDGTTLVLGLVLCAQTQLALWYERKHRDPFVLLLAAEMIVYYALRLYTLTIFRFSLVFDRYPYDPADSNRALVFILIANLFLYGAFFLVKSGGMQAVSAGAWRPTVPGRTVLLLIAAILIGYSSIHYGVEDEPSNLASLLSFFLEPRTVIMMTLTFYLLFRDSLGRVFAVTIATLMILEMAVHTLAGSRSALVAFIENCALVVLAIRGCIRFPRRYFVLGVVLSPLIALAMVGSFAISTYNRGHREGSSFDVGQALSTATQQDLGLAMDLAMPALFARAGFFDFSAEIMAHRDEYASVLNTGAYGRSIVDNLLTPGFDVYDQPRTSSALQFIYRDWGEPSKDAAAEFYQTDQLGIYGEYYGVFGYASLPLLFVTAYLLKLAFVRLRGANPFTLAMKRLVVLFVYVDLLHSYGVDWVLIETVPLLVAIFLYGPFFVARRQKTIEPAATAVAAARGI